MAPLDGWPRWLDRAGSVTVGPLPDRCYSTSDRPRPDLTSAPSGGAGGTVRPASAAIAESPGLVSRVDTRVMRTSIAKTVELITCRSIPTLRTTSSVRPRQFISTPRDSDSAQPTPVSRAATALPTSLPTTATAVTSAYQAHSRPSARSRPKRVRRPTETKNSGSSRVDVTPRTCSAARRTGSTSRGVITPNRNAPKIGWIPIVWVASADSNTPHSISTANPTDSATVTQTPPADRCRATALTTASRHQAVTSSTAAQVSAVEPSGVSASLRSDRIRASTGNAVTLIDTARNSPNAGKPTSPPSGRYIASANPRPDSSGSAMLTWLTSAAVYRRRRTNNRFISSPTRNMNRTRPSWPSRLIDGTR